MTQILNWLRDNWLALGALIVSVTALIVSAVAQKRSYRNQKRLVEIEEAREKDRVLGKTKANLVPSIIEEVDSLSRPRHSLRIKNIGLAAARNIKIKLDGSSLSEHPAYKHPSIPMNQRREIQELEADCFIDYRLALSMEIQPPFDIEITWSDDSGEPGLRKASIKG